MTGHRDNVAETSIERVDALTPRQRECLRLVSRDRDAKEIARILEIAPETVITHLKAAMAKLGVNSRFAAARMLAEQEGCHHPLVTPSEVIEVSPDSGTKEASFHHADLEPDRYSVRELSANFDAFGLTARRLSLSAARGANRNDLTKPQRLSLVLAAALLPVGCFAAAAMIYTVQRLLQSANLIQS